MNMKRLIQILLSLIIVASCAAWSPVPIRLASKPVTLQATKIETGDEQLSSLPPSAAVDFEKYVWYLPPVFSAGAFFLYSETSRAFHTFIVNASGHTWERADGGKYMADIVKPVLNGPVTLSISILFGTLVAMTIQTLFNRQISLHKMAISTVEEIKELRLLLEGFPEPYRSRGAQLLESYLTKSYYDFSTGQVSKASLRKKEIPAMTLMLNSLSAEKDCPSLIWQAYGSVQRLKDLRGELIGALETEFSPAHYGNIVVLAVTLLFVFLLETDQDAMQFLLDFQLSICWALLIGSFSMLSVVIYDLTTPFSGVFNIMQGNDADAESLIAYALGIDDDEMMNTYL